MSPGVRADIEILLVVVLPAEMFSSFIFLWDGPASNSSVLLVAPEVDDNYNIVASTGGVDFDEDLPAPLLLLLSDLDQNMLFVFC